MPIILSPFLFHTTQKCPKPKNKTPKTVLTRKQKAPTLKYPYLVTPNQENGRQTNVFPKIKSLILHSGFSMTSVWCKNEAKSWVGGYIFSMMSIDVHTVPLYFLWKRTISPISISFALPKPLSACLVGLGFLTGGHQICQSPARRLICNEFHTLAKTMPTCIIWPTRKQTTGDNNGHQMWQKTLLISIDL